MKNRCNSCGLCCKLFYINLSKDEYKYGNYQTIFGDIRKIENFNEAKSCGANLLKKNDKDECVYLVDNKCGIHDKRPAVCRDFFCNSKSKKFQGMREIIENEKRL